MVDAGYNPQGMLDLFHVLQQAGGSGGPAFLADHPLTSTRIEHARQRIAEMNPSDFRPEVPLP
jgi:predicted Zn-dependent protease